MTIISFLSSLITTPQLHAYGAVMPVQQPIDLVNIHQATLRAEWTNHAAALPVCVRNHVTSGNMRPGLCSPSLCGCYASEFAVQPCIFIYTP